MTPAKPNGLRENGDDVELGAIEIVMARTFVTEHGGWRGVCARGHRPGEPAVQTP